MMKKNGETAQLTATQPPQTHSLNSTQTRETPIIPSYYDEAYSVGQLDLSLVKLDTECTSHMFGSRILLSNLRQTPPSPIHVASKTGKIYASQRGSAHMGQLRLKNVIYSSELSANLISAGMLYDEGYDIQ